MAASLWDDQTALAQRCFLGFLQHGRLAALLEVREPKGGEQHGTEGPGSGLSKRPAGNSLREGKMALSPGSAQHHPTRTATSGKLCPGCRQDKHVESQPQTQLVGSSRGLGSAP